MIFLKKGITAEMVKQNFNLYFSYYTKLESGQKKHLTSVKYLNYLNTNAA